MFLTDLPLTRGIGRNSFAKYNARHEKGFRESHTRQTARYG